MLHLVNVRATYSQFSGSVVLNTHSKTIITENPATNDAKALTALAFNMGNDYEMLCNNKKLPEITSITTVMTAKQLTERANDHGIGSETEFTAVFHGIITTFDLDGPTKLYTRKW